MKTFFLLLFCLISASALAQQPRTSSSSQAKVNLEGSNNNVVKIIQAGVVVTYDLTKDQEAHKLLSYLKSMPSISKQLDQLGKGLTGIADSEKEQTKLLNLLVKLITSSTNNGFTSSEEVQGRIQNYLEENEKLKAEIAQLQAQNQDTVFATVLTQAEEKLKQLDHQAYQQLLEEFKLKRKKKLQKEKQQIAQVAYLQAQDSYNQFQYDKALLQVEEAIEYDRKNPNYLLLKGIILGDKYHLQEALDIYLSINSPLLNDTLTGTLFRKIGIIYYYKEEYDKALDYYQKALSIHSEILGEQNSDVAHSYNNIGLIYYYKGEYDKALEYHNRALSIRLKALGEQHPDLATSYGNIGLIYNSKEEYDKALDYYHKAFHIRLKFLGEQHPSVAHSYNNIGLIYYYKGEYDKALEYHNRALSIRLKALGEQHPSVAHSYSNIGAVYYYKEEYDKALAYYYNTLLINLKVLRQQPYVKIISGNIVTQQASNIPISIVLLSLLAIGTMGFALRKRLKPKKEGT